MKIEVFDPPMCCPTGICGPNIDPELLKIQDAILTLKKQGVEVERYGLAQQIDKFMSNEIIADLINKNGSKVLPITLVNGTVFKTGTYATYEELCQALRLDK
jgi:hypothetical protein